MRLRKCFKNFVTVRLEGLALEKILNLCISKGIDIWDVKREKYTLLEFKINLKNYKKLVEFSKKYGFRVSIIEENSYKKWTNKFLKRKMLVVGAFFSFIVLFYLSGFIFRIDVVGNDIICRENVLMKLEEVGFKTGVRHHNIDLRAIENFLMIHIPELAWVGIEIRGVYAEIKISEKVPSPNRADKNIPANVVARKNGVIESIIARGGDAVVKKGDIVAEGDLLISGVLFRENIYKLILTHAFGEVYARTYYELEETHPLFKIVQKKTGNRLSEIIVFLGETEYNIGKEEVKFDKYITEKKNYEIVNCRNREIFVEAIHIEHFEVIEVTRRLEHENVREALHKVLLEVLESKVSKESEIVDTKIEFKVIGDYMQAQLWAEVIEDIGIKKQIELNE